LSADERGVVAAGAEGVGDFLREDQSYLAAADLYGDGGEEALERALRLFLSKPELGFVWARFDAERVVGGCVVCYAISTSRGTLVAKLDDVSVAGDYRGKGAGTTLIDTLGAELRQLGSRVSIPLYTRPIPRRAASMTSWAFSL